MKRSVVVMSLLCILLGAVFVSVQALAGDAMFTVARLVVCESVADREPVGPTNTVAAGTEEISCFLEATDIAANTMVTFVWLHEGTPIGEMTLPIKKGPRWRTHATKKLGSWTGNWKVELRNDAGELMDSVDFVVE